MAAAELVATLEALGGLKVWSIMDADMDDDSQHIFVDALLSVSATTTVREARAATGNILMA